jgi:hypothetical protein
MTGFVGVSLLRPGLLFFFEQFDLGFMPRLSVKLGPMQIFQHLRPIAGQSKVHSSLKPFTPFVSAAAAVELYGRRPTHVALRHRPYAISALRTLTGAVRAAPPPPPPPLIQTPIRAVSSASRHAADALGAPALPCGSNSSNSWRRATAAVPRAT